MNQFIPFSWRLANDRNQERLIRICFLIHSSGSESDVEDSSEESDFQKPPTRGGADIWKLAKKNPGRLLRSGMEEMSRYLADRVGTGQRRSPGTRGRSWPT